MSESELIERDRVLAAVEDAVVSSRDGRGRTLVIEGGPGLGKTVLLRAAFERARAAGMTVRAAQGGELEQSLAWGLARELISAPARAGLATVPSACRPALGLEGGEAGEDPLAVAFGLTEVCGELAGSQPLALLVDDAHWGDSPSMTWLAYLAPRVRELAVLLIVAGRPRDPRRPPELDTLAARDGVEAHELHPLSRAGVAQLVRRTNREADDALCGRCHEMSGGNAFLLVELLRELRSAERAHEELDLTSMTLERVGRVIGRRLAAAGADAARLARSASVFGASAALADVAAAAELDPVAAPPAADALRAADVLADVGGDQIAFAHPLIRSAVHRSIAPGERSLLHLTAARHLFAQGRTPEQVGLHLLAAEPGADPWVRERLIAAADAAMASGAPRNAVLLYQRAAAERVGSPDARLLSKLGRAAMLFDPPAAEEPLLRALVATTDPLDKVPLALDLAVVLQTLRRSGDAVEVLEGVGRELEDAGAPRSVRLRVEAEVLAQSFFDARTAHLRRVRLPALAGTLTGTDEEEALIRVQQTVEAINTGTAEEARSLAEQAWAGGRLVELAGSPTTPAVMWIPYARLYVDDYQWTIDVATDWLHRARDAGSAVLATFANAMLGEAQWRAGMMRDAQASGEAAWEIARELGSGFPGWWMALGVLAEALIARARPHEAVALLDGEGLLDGRPLEIMLMPMPRAVRGEVLIAAGRTSEGVADLLGAHDWLLRQSEPSPGGWRFYSTLVDGLISLGRQDEAADLARAWLRRARRFGALAPRGMAERALALTASGERQIDGLRRGERMLGQSGARAEHARALIELGAAMRRARMRADAREPLRSALETATRLGADALAQRARVELLATGARPRRAVQTGADALTASERRVAQLAAGGLSNREIAGSLFISRKTVERHLANIYVKLGTNERGRLGDLIEA